MIIERNLARYIVFIDDEIGLALNKISANKLGIVFVTTHNGVLEGILTDGDVRRWLLQTKELNLTLPVSTAFNTQFTSAFEDSPEEEIEKLFSARIEFIPLLDKQKRLVAIASLRSQNIQIDNYTISKDGPAFIIAEIGNNHNGDIVLAKRLVDEAKKSGANCAKFQLRDLATMYRNSGKNKNDEDLGAEYTLDLLSKFQLRKDELFEVFDYCKQLNIIPLCTPWDASSLQALESYGMSAYKVASADLTNHEFLENLAKTRKPLICSTGMSTETEIRDSVALLRRHGCPFILLHCNSTYPAPFKDINLKYMPRLAEMTGCIVGYSGHERGIAIAISAVALGAKVIEKHFTLDRNMEGNDHRVSILPDEFSAMVQSIRDVELGLGHSESRKVTQGEMMNREILGKSLMCVRELKVGDTIQAEDIETRSPGKGLAPYLKTELIGKTTQRHIAQGDFFYPSDLNATKILPRPYTFKRPFGVPVRYHDLDSMLTKTNLNLVEFHFSYKDLDLNPEDTLPVTGYDLDFVVHSPELFAGDHVLDLCAQDIEYRQRSITELQRVINTTRKLKPYFHRCTKPFIIINAGGFTQDGFLPKSARNERYALIAEAIHQLDTEGVEIIPQTMPPYPWHFGGQRFHNLFIDEEDIVDFCNKNNVRVCLDISHSKLACNLNKKSFSHFIQKVAPYSAHIHIVDADGIDGEGLQIGDGEIDFSLLATQLRELAPSVSFIPEIWQGHKNGGEGFWIALEKLERLAL